MFWTYVLPFQITCVVLIISVLVLTAFASPKSWGRASAFCMYSAIAIAAFTPLCSVIKMTVDSVRFGDFSYASYEYIPDLRSRCHVPKKATDIKMRKHAGGNFSRYKLPADEFESHLDNLWRQHGEHSAFERGALSDEGKSVGLDYLNMTFGDLGWELPSDAIVHYSPHGGNGSGSKYYVDPDSEVVFQHTGFW